MRKELYSPLYKRYVKETYRKFARFKGYTSKITDSFIEATAYLIADKNLPDRFKAHKIKRDIWELHLVSYNSDCLLVYAKRKIEDIPVLYIYAITDHDGLDRIVKLTSSMEDNHDERTSQNIDSSLAD